VNPVLHCTTQSTKRFEVNDLTAPKQTTINLQELNENSTVTTNVEQEYIVTTCDKVRLILIECEENKKLATSWWTYLGMAFSFICPLFTAVFQPFLFFSADEIKGFFILMSILFSILTIIGIYRRITKREKITIEYCVDRIKNSKKENR